MATRSYVPWSARPDGHHAAVWRFVFVLKPHIPDGLSAGDAAGIVGDLSPASALARRIVANLDAVAAGTVAVLEDGSPAA